jgi:hypothetical protein
VPFGNLSDLFYNREKADFERMIRIMNSTIDKLQNLNKSIQKLEAVLQEFWSSVEELEDDLDFKKIVKDPKFRNNLEEFNTCLDSIPQDGTTVTDLEDTIADLIDTIKTL